MDGPTPKPKEITDAELLRAYQQTTGRANDMIANALLAEIARRDLDV
ncbi:hypothetical protein [Sphingomonas sp. Leaf208]|jgi:hypothetical protein|nr:hypothetical protein [Sphingomonas sp. Leaf208]